MPIANTFIYSLSVFLSRPLCWTARLVLLWSVMSSRHRINDAKLTQIITFHFTVVFAVYVGRICTPMLRQDVGARGSRAEGSE